MLVSWSKCEEEFTRPGVFGPGCPVWKAEGLGGGVISEAKISLLRFPAKEKNRESIPFFGLRR